MTELVLVIDLGSQYTQLIARRVRENRVYCEILPYHQVTAAAVGEKQPLGLILSGGPASVYAENAPTLPAEIFDLGLPVLGICYGMQLGVQLLGGRVGSGFSGGSGGEYGRTELRVIEKPEAESLFHGVGIDDDFGEGRQTTVWMSHGDLVEDPGPQFVPLARTRGCPVAAIRHKTAPFFGLQFHPEVSHTIEGSAVFKNFLTTICKAHGDWEMGSFIEENIAQIRDTVGPDGHVICALSGGVDSSVVAALLDRAIGERCHSIYVDNGLMRLGETELIKDVFGKQTNIDLHIVDAETRFLAQLAGVTEPEEKRIRIGHEFIRVFEEEAKKIAGADFLAQGTLYPDVIESVPAHGGPTATIKRHHNVGGLPEHMNLKLIEPLRMLFKDEVREIGLHLGLPEAIVWRHPFPGPGLGVRILGEVTKERCDLLRLADRVVVEEIKAGGLYRATWQAFAVLLPVRSVGVMGDERTYANVAAIRVIESRDGMTADWARLPDDVLNNMSRRITNEIRGINRVVYDISTKPPATIEWE